VFEDPFASLEPHLPVRDLINEPVRLAGQVAPHLARALAVALLGRVGQDPDAGRYLH
jgi:peptide/nickel transport system ATP-binding protein/glutathione transport system ATP-binding protein